MFIRKPEMKTLFRISGRKTGSSVKLVIKKTAWESVNWIYFAQHST